MGAAVAARAVLTPPALGASWARAAGVPLAVAAATEAARQVREWVPEVAAPQRSLVSWALLAAADYGEPVPPEVAQQLNAAAGDEGAQSPAAATPGGRRPSAAGPGSPLSAAAAVPRTEGW